MQKKYPRDDNRPNEAPAEPTKNQNQDAVRETLSNLSIRQTAGRKEKTDLKSVEGLALKKPRKT